MLHSSVRGDPFAEELRQLIAACRMELLKIQTALNNYDIIIKSERGITMTNSQNTGKNHEESPKIVNFGELNQWTLPPWDPKLSVEENQKRRSAKILEQSQKKK